MNINIEPFYCFIKREHLFGYESNFGEFENVFVFGARSIPGRALVFHLMTDGGAQRANVPISALVHRTDAPEIGLDFLQLWDCFGYKINCIVFDYLLGKRCKVIMKDKSVEWGSYMMTFDWEENVYSNTPHDYKNAHMIKMDNGCFTLQPNNRIFWKDSNFITKPLEEKNLPKYKVDKNIFICENSDRWVSEDSDCFYYDIKNTKDKNDL